MLDINARSASGFISIKGLALLALSSLLPASVSAQTVVVQEGDWQVVLDTVASSLMGKTCVISSVNEVEGGRRERPRIRIIPATRQIAIDPDRYMSSVITGIAMLEHRSERYQPNRLLSHLGRVDDGEVFTAEEQNPNYGNVELTKDAAGFAEVMQELSSGKVLRYEWQLGRGGKTYEYSLAGFANMKDAVAQNPACQSGK